MTYLEHKSDLGGVGSAAVNVASDPCLSEVVTLVTRLHGIVKVEAAKEKGAARARAAASRSSLGASSSGAGIGLCVLVKPLRVAVKVRENPWILPVVGGGVVLGLIGLGYYLRGRKRR